MELRNRIIIFGVINMVIFILLSFLVYYYGYKVGYYDGVNSTQELYTDCVRLIIKK